MGLSYIDCERLGIAHLHPDHPGNARPAPVAVSERTPAARRSKYNAKPTTYNGVRYHSKAEAVRAERLDFEQRAGLIRGWIGQPTFRLGVAENVYKSDFLVFSLDGRVHAEDVKGAEAPKFRRDKRLWARYGPCPLKILRGGKVVEVIDPEQIKIQEGHIDNDDVF